MRTRVWSAIAPQPLVLLSQHARRSAAGPAAGSGAATAGGTAWEGAACGDVRAGPGALGVAADAPGGAPAGRCLWAQPARPPVGTRAGELTTASRARRVDRP